MYTKDLISLMKVLGSNMSKIFQCCLKKEKTEIEIDIMNGIVGSVKRHEKISHFIVSGILQYLYLFIKYSNYWALIAHYTTTALICRFKSVCLNLGIVIITYSSYYPMSNLDAVYYWLVQWVILFPAELYRKVISKAIRICWNLLYTNTNAPQV